MSEQLTPDRLGSRQLRIVPSTVSVQLEFDRWLVRAARLLPYLEEQVLGETVDFSRPYAEAVLIGGRRLSSFRIRTYLCPSEPHDFERLDSFGEPQHCPLNYAVNLGVWLVWDPASGRGGRGAFFPDSRLTVASFRDGLSKTVCAAEVRAYTPYGAMRALPAN